MNMKKSVLIFIVLWNAVSAWGQDIHFSQFFNTPTALNPALCGLFRYDYRATAIYRNQWRQANATYSTIALSGDMNFTINPITNDKLGVGLFLFNDQIGDGNITNKTVVASVAYHKILDKQKRNRLSVGIQAGYVQKGIDYTHLTFGNQIVDYELDPTLSTGEGTNTSIGYVNLNAGIGWMFKVNPKLDIHTGLSTFNVVSPKETFSNAGIQLTNPNELKMRPLWYGGVEYLISDKFSVHPEVMYVYQSKAHELNIGSAVGYTFKKVKDQRQMVLLGLWWRTRDAAVLMAGYRFKNYNICLTYDYTGSDLRTIRNTPQARGGIVGAYEITFTYMGLFKRALPNNHTIPCGIF
jgi:type IX secretion system PorP/SprF family membrane protein